MTLKISISGVRGFVPESLTPEVCLDFAKAFGSYLRKNNKQNVTVVVGTDPRASSEFIKGIVFSGLLNTGCRVIDIGICPTPTVGLMIKELKADGGIVITASHNPLPWNGLKFMRSDGIFLNEAQANKFLKIYESKDFYKGLPDQLHADHSAIAKHISKVLKVIPPRAVRRKKFRVAIDCCNGAGSIAAVKLLEKLGCKVLPLNCDLNQPFPHDPEPVARNLKDLSRLVRSGKADIGFALDSDADRLAIIDETGKAIGEELTLALAVRHVLQKNEQRPSGRNLVITNLSTTRAIDDIAEAFSGLVIRTKIGEVHVAEQLKELRGLIGGEGNGGIIYPPVGFNRDSLTGIALILQLLAVSGKSVSGLVAEVPHYFMIKEKERCNNQQQAEKFINRAKEGFPKKNLILTEGVKVMLSRGWVHVRASNTEPIIRIIAEGREKKEVQRLIKQVIKSFR
ncbi:MAG: phosphoglucosamine mutase [Candidatus Saganbacteria bacterium]|nr:phosphoglucosamine mutase [Candidatus Saganbacteria bacterium]